VLPTQAWTRHLTPTPTVTVTVTVTVTWRPATPPPLLPLALVSMLELTTTMTTMTTTMTMMTLREPREPQVRSMATAKHSLRGLRLSHCCHRWSRTPQTHPTTVQPQQWPCPKQRPRQLLQPVTLVQVLPPLLPVSLLSLLSSPLPLLHRH
jgi:hypothetical protein